MTVAMAITFVALFTGALPKHNIVVGAAISLHIASLVVDGVFLNSVSAKINSLGMGNQVDVGAGAGSSKPPLKF